MRIMFPGWRGFFAIGRDTEAQTNLDMRMSLCWGYHPRAFKDGRYRTNIHIAWNWLPDRHYQTIVADGEGVDSSLWTGRTMRLSRIGKWQRFVSWIDVRLSKEK